MIKGIGSDIIEIERIEKAIQKKSFLEKCFTTKEIEFFEQKKYAVETIAVTFAAKEAASKALGTGFRGFKINEIEVLRNKMGNPYFNFYGNFQEICNSIGIDIIHVSLSHCKEYAVAFAIAEGGIKNESSNTK